MFFVLVWRAYQDMQEMQLPGTWASYQAQAPALEERVGGTVGI